MSKGKERPRPVVIRRGSFLAPWAAADEALLKGFPLNRPMTVEIVGTSRSGRQQRLYWALLNMVCEHAPGDMQSTALHSWLKIRLGVIECVVLRTGEVVEMPGSTSYAAMEHEEFTAYMGRVKDLIADLIFPVVNTPEFARALSDILGPDF